MDGDTRDRLVSPRRPYSSWLPDPARMRLRDALTSRGARRWFSGAFVAGVVSLIFNAHQLLQQHPLIWTHWLVMAHAVLYILVFAVIPPVSWGRTETVKWLMVAVLLLLSVPFLLNNGADGGWMWTYVTVAAGMQMHPRRTIFPFLAAMGVTSWAVQLAAGIEVDESLVQPILVVSMGMMMAAFAAQIAAVRELQRTRHELAELAVREERSRVARDMHDILGHSLTVITVKAELAGRLLDLDRDRAAAEISQVEELSRDALADVRATLRGYREVTVTAELAAARSALAAAGIDATLPGSADIVAGPRRELFGWVLREGITNVVRHSHASRCVVTLGQDWIQIDDDGVGPASDERSAVPAPVDSNAAGSDLADSALIGEDGAHAGPGESSGDSAATGAGLAGLGERVRAAGASMSIGVSDLGGFRLAVRL